MNLTKSIFIFILILFAKSAFAVEPSPDCAGFVNKLADVRELGKNSLYLIQPEIQFTPEETEMALKEIKATTSDSYDAGQIAFFFWPGTREVLPQLRSTFPPAVLSKLRQFREYLAKIHVQIYGREPGRVDINMRVTSSTYGFAIRDGLHMHGGEGHMDFVWGVKGLGTRFLFPDGQLRTVPENLLALFGPEVMHDSPPSIEDRLIMLGSTWIVDPFPGF